MMSASVFVPAMAEGARRLWCSNADNRSLRSTMKKTMRTVKFATVSRNRSGTKHSSFRIQSSDHRSEKRSYGAGEADEDSGIQDDDLSFLWKLGVGSLAAAAAIKYGSILFPDITTPNIVPALFMIFTPVVAAVVLLIRASYLKKQNQNSN